ncbi:hypothetical protein ACFXGA_35260 [Actinosynnema sp. NPDC059335]
MGADPVRATAPLPSGGPSPLVVLLMCLVGAVVTIGILRLLRPRGNVR